MTSSHPLQLACTCAQLCLTLCDPTDCSPPQSMGFPRQACWSRLPFPPLGLAWAIVGSSVDDYSYSMVVSSFMLLPWFSSHQDSQREATWNMSSITVPSAPSPPWAPVPLRKSRALRMAYRMPVSLTPLSLYICSSASCYSLISTHPGLPFLCHTPTFPSGFIVHAFLPFRSLLKCKLLWEFFHLHKTLPLPTVYLSYIFHVLHST